MPSLLSEGSRLRDAGLPAVPILDPHNDGSFHADGVRRGLLLADGFWEGLLLADGVWEDLRQRRDEVLLGVLHAELAVALRDET